MGIEDYDLFKPTDSSQPFAFHVPEQTKEKNAEMVDFIPEIDDSNMTVLFFDKIRVYKSDFLTGERTTISGPDVRNDFPYMIYDSKNKAIFKTDYSKDNDNIIPTCVYFYHRKPVSAVLSDVVYLHDNNLTFDESSTQWTSLLAYIYHDSSSKTIDIRPVGQITNKMSRRFDVTYLIISIAFYLQKRVIWDMHR